MAIFHFTAKNILRTQGKSATAAAAYRATDRIADSYTGLVHDYSRKQWCVHKEILLPENAPSEFADRAALWNAAEWAEDSPNGRVARELEFSLPVELTRDQQTDLARRFIQEMFVDDGMVADWAIHNPPVRDSRGVPLDVDGNPTNDPAKMIFRNPHVHCLLTVRPLDRKGRFEPKSQKEYVCKNPRTGEEKPLISSEFTALRPEGWEKEYRYRVGGEKVWLTRSEAEAMGLGISDRVFKNPRATMRGRENPSCARWNSEQTLREWRKAWADAANAEFERLGMDARVDHRSFVDQSREDEIPQVHVGPAGTHSRKGHSERAALNEAIKVHNASVRERKAVEAEIHHQIHEKAESLDHLRVDAAVTSYTDTAVEMLTLEEDAQYRRISDMEMLERELHIIAGLNESALKTMEALLSSITFAGVIIMKGHEAILKRVEKERRDIDTRNGYAEDRLRQFDCHDLGELQQKIRQLRDEIHTSRKKHRLPDRDPRSVDEMLEEYREILASVPASLRQELEEEMKRIESGEDHLPAEDINPEAFEEALSRVDEQITEIRAGREEPAEALGRAR